MLKYSLIFFASGLGGMLRYWFGRLVQGWWDSSLGINGWWSAGFPVGTLVINVTGCAAIGFLAAAFSGALLIRQDYQIAILVGLLGGYTTLSAFGRETIALFHDGRWVSAGMYVLLTNAIGLAAVWLGAVAASKWFGTGTA